MKKYLLVTGILFYVIPSLHSQDIVNVKDINTAGSSYPHDLIISNDKLFFIAQDASNYKSLWVTLGSDATTTNVGPFGGVSNSLQELQNYNNKIYFAYNDGVNGQEPWVSDGTTAGTIILKDIYPGSTSSDPQNFTVANNTLFFLANNTNGTHRLYASDGTAANTIVIKDNIVAGFNGERSLAVLNDMVYFNSDDGSGSGFGLWKSDGTLAGTTLVQAGDNVANFKGNSPVLNNKMYFDAYDNVHGDELWVTDGTNAGTHIVKDINTSGSGEPENFSVYHNKIYFSANDGINGEELWVTDGSAAGTQIVKDILPGASGSQPRSMTVYNDTLYFICWATQQLWKTDGTDANTQLVKGSFTGTIFSATWNNKIYMFSAPDFTTFQSDGTTTGTTSMKADNTTFPITHYAQYGSDDYDLEYHNELYFQASVFGITTGFELVKLTNGALPLHLISFTGEVLNDNDILKWVTANEINTASFIIEESLDGSVFTNAGVIAAKINSVYNNEYNYTQKSAFNIGGFYRLKMVDKDGAYTYSPVIKLKRESTSILKATYHAADNSILIKNQTHASCNWQIFSINGNLIKQGASINSIINIPVPNISRGIYIVLCKANDVTISVKLEIN